MRMFVMDEMWNLEDFGSCEEVGNVIDEWCGG